MSTLAELEARFGVETFDYLVKDAEVPTVTRAACQGDVSILRVTTQGATNPIPRDGVAVVRGENGGNTHSLHGDGCYFDFLDQTRGADTSLRLGVLTVPARESAYLLHPEHGAMEIASGTYQIGRQREWAGEWRQVAD